MRTRSWLLLATTLACAPTAHTPSWLAPEAGGQLAYRVRLEPLGLRSAAAVDVIVTAPPGGALPQPATFSVPQGWAGHDDLGDDLIDMTAEDETGHALIVDRAPGVAAVYHDGARALRLRYRLRPSARELTEASRFRAVGAPELLLAYGRDLFVRPAWEGAEDPGVSVVLTAEQPGVTWVTTLGGAGEEVHLRQRSFRPLIDAAYLAGRPRLVWDGLEGRVLLAVDPELGVVEDDLLGMAERVVAYQAMVYGPPAIPTTVGLIVLRRDAPDAVTGSGRPGGFVLELGSGVQGDSTDLSVLVAHENLHRYLGFEVTFDRETALETLWLKEGVVSYLASLTAVYAGMAPPEVLLDALSDALTGYRTNDAQRAAIGVDDGGFWVDDGRRRRPYERGFLLAFWLDQRLRRVGDRLDRAVAALVEVHRSGSPLRLVDITAFFAHRTADPGLARQLESFVLEGGPLPWNDWLTEAGLEVREQREAAAYVGFETSRERGGTWRVTAIDPAGPAARSVLRVGDRLLAPPDWRRLHPAGWARLVVVRDGAPRDVSFRTAAGERVTWRVVDDGRLARAMGWAPQRSVY